MLRAPSAAGRRFDSLEQQVFLSLWRAYDRLHAVEVELFTQHNLSPQQYNLLRLVRAARPEKIPTLSLAQHMVSRAPDITRMLDKLEQRRLIERLRKPGDRRAVLVGITARGLALLEEIAEPLRACHFKQLGHLSARDLRQLAELLQTVVQPHEPVDSPWRADKQRAHPGA